MKSILSVLIAVLLSGCASESFSVGAGNLSKSLVDRSLINGRTTKADVVALLGEPQSQVSGSFGGVNVDVWGYSKMFFRDASEKYGFAGAVAYSMANPYSGGYDRWEVSSLAITFNSSGRVINHTYTTAHTGGSL